MRLSEENISVDFTLKQLKRLLVYFQETLNNNPLVGISKFLDDDKGGCGEEGNPKDLTREVSPKIEEVNRQEASVHCGIINGLYIVY